MTFTTWLAIAASTLVSEDLACAAAGVLMLQGVLSPASALSSCAAGIFVGDLALWGLGRAGATFLLPRSVVGQRLADAATALRTRSPWTVRAALVTSRVVPGTRLPLYVACGLTGVPARLFAIWVGGAVVVWTPIVVLGSAGVARLLSGSGASGTGGAVRHLLAVAALVTTMAAVRRIVTHVRRHQWGRVLDRVAQWEFWPMWLFYLPLVPWIGWLSLRHGGLSTMTAANPGIRDGGTVGESKSEILSRLDEDDVLPFRRIRASGVCGDSGVSCSSDEAERVALAARAVEEMSLTFPVVLKPDVGERGRGVRIAQTHADIVEYCRQCAEAFLVQQYHPGPYEAGVFYYRVPGAPRGHVLSITDKRFPFIVGDGRSSLEQLITQHPRYRLQADVFLSRHAATRARVLAEGEPFQLARAGNHSKGTMFLDGESLRTEALDARIDAIARSYDGFFIGRFDIRYSDPWAFRKGRGLAILELNGATAEPTDLYDPRRSLFTAYRILFRQWALVFQIGAANRRRGAATTPLLRLARLARASLHAPALASD